MQSWTTPSKQIDEKTYNATVLRLASMSSEDDLDDRVALEAQGLGLLPLQITPDIDGITSSVSTVTIASNSIKQSSVQSQSTAPTSCASSEHRPATQSSHASQQSPMDSGLSSHVSEGDKKRNSPLRRGFRKMAVFRKKRSAALTTSSTLSSISSDADTNNSGDVSEDIQSPSSIKSSKSSWSQPVYTSKSSYDRALPVDEEALKRSMECMELVNLRMAQLDEKARFLEFQTSLISHLRSERDKIKAQRKSEHEEVVAGQMEKVGWLIICWS